VLFNDTFKDERNKKPNSTYTHNQPNPTYLHVSLVKKNNFPTTKQTQKTTTKTKQTMIHKQSCGSLKTHTPTQRKNQKHTKPTAASKTQSKTLQSLNGTAAFSLFEETVFD
jgi:hypothetical protein